MDNQHSDGVGSTGLSGASSWRQDVGESLSIRDDGISCLKTLRNDVGILFINRAGWPKI